jgi:hypothetical protein
LASSSLSSLSIRERGVIVVKASLCRDSRRCYHVIAVIVVVVDIDVDSDDTVTTCRRVE